MQVFKKHIMLSYSDVLGQLKFNKHLTGIDSSCEEKIKNIIIESKSLIEPHGVFERFKISSVKEEEVFLEDFGLIKSKSISTLVKDCSAVVLFLVTIGNKISDEIVKSAAEKNVFKALVLDGIGSVAVEQCADEINAIVTMQSKIEGLKTTRRFSPGYGDFTVSDNQALILEKLDAINLGVNLTASGVMLPEKTVTALIGLL